MSVDVGTSDFHPSPTSKNAKITGVHESLLQECEKDIIWYRENFSSKAHHNLMATESPNGPLAISYIRDESKGYKALVRTTQGSERILVPADEIKAQLLRKVFGLGPSSTTILQAINKDLPIDHLKACRDPNLPNELLAMEERQVIRSYKFGLAYLAKGQSTEEEMFRNRMEDTSPEFKDFLNFLGETIELKGWKGYRAGLDVAQDQTGKNSVYTKWQGYEVMFHVAPLLPYVEADKQQLERKRHIGNDIVIIIFQQDPSVPYKLQTITSKQNHVICVVSPKGDGYDIIVAPKKGVPPFTPELPEPAHIKKDATSRDFFLHKLVNGERASYKAPSFATKISRTRQVLLFDVAERFLG